MESEADGLLVAEGDGLAGRLVGRDGDESDPARGRLGGLDGEEGEVDLLHDVEDRFGLERRTVETLLDLGGEASIEGLGLQALDHLAVGIANAHRRNLLDRC
jgi:hypothetical protein